LLQLPQLAVGQAGGGAGVGLGVQPHGLDGQAEPAGEGLGVDAEDAGDGRAGLALGDQHDGTLPAALQFSSSANGSTHTVLDAPAEQKGALNKLAPVGLRHLSTQRNPANPLRSHRPEAPAVTCGAAVLAAYHLLASRSDAG
jgi:hypothetical protein